MKRFRFWLMAALVMIFAVFAASCDGASGGTAGETEHQHNFEYGSCRECGEADPGVHFDFRLNTNTDDKTYELRGGGSGCAVLAVPKTYQGYPVVSIGEKAFYERNIREVILHEGIQTIGGAAFARCEALEKVTIPEGVTSIGGNAFYRCRRLQEITIPGSVRTIGAAAFSSCNRLVTIAIGDGVQEIWEYAFSGCGTSGAIENLTLPASTTVIAKGSFAGTNMVCLTVNGSGGCSISEQAFSGCALLKTVVIGDGIASIGESAFDFCSALETVVIGNGVENIGKWAFAKSGVQTVAFSDTVQIIEANAFSGCSRLQSVTLPDGLRTIGEDAFNGCVHLNSVTLGRNLQVIGAYAFSIESTLLEIVNRSALPLAAGSKDYGGIAKNARTIRTEAGERQYFATTEDGYRFYEDDEVSYLLQYVGDETELILPESSPSGRAYSIYTCAFYEDDRITAVTIPACVRRIDPLVFTRCTSLTSLAFACTDGWYEVYRGEHSAIDASDPAKNASRVELEYYLKAWVRE